MTTRVSGFVSSRSSTSCSVLQPHRPSVCLLSTVSTSPRTAALRLPLLLRVCSGSSEWFFATSTLSSHVTSSVFGLPCWNYPSTPHPWSSSITLTWFYSIQVIFQYQKLSYCPCSDTTLRDTPKPRFLWMSNQLIHMKLREWAWHTVGPGQLLLLLLLLL